MDGQEFREFAKAAIDFIVDYYENIRDRNVIPDVQPGYLQEIMPLEAPDEPESWREIMKDMNDKILPGCTHWQSPNFHAYYPSENSYASIVGEMISIALGPIGFNWLASPVCTELEVIVMNWMGRMLGLPKEFLNVSESLGGGIIQGTASEATIVCLLACRERTVTRLNPSKCPSVAAEIRSKLRAYTSDQANTCVEKGALIAAIQLRLLETNKNFELEGITLERAIKEDLSNGLIPCFVVGTLGTTGICAFDKINDIGNICKKYDLWLHIDAAYAGTALACPEYRHLLDGIEYVESFVFNPHKSMLVNFDCSALWVRNSRYLINAFNLNPSYLKHEHEKQAFEYRHWEMPLGRRFRSLKVWFVLRSFGISGIQKHVRHHVALAEYFCTKVSKDNRFEILAKNLGLVCFRLIGENNRSEILLEELTKRKLIFCVPVIINGTYIIRFAISSTVSKKSDIDFAWNEIIYNTDKLFSNSSCNQGSGVVKPMFHSDSASG